MGGFGSGRRPTRNTGTVSDMRRLDVRKMKREGCLEHGASGRWCWSRDGETVASVCYQALPGALRLVYNVTEQGKGPESLDYRVGLEWTPCYYGGARVWFQCPTCGRRVAILYGGRVFACRECHRLVYDCQRETPDERVSRQLDKQRELLKWVPGLLNGKQWKPKWMRWRTYHRLEAEYDEHMRLLKVLVRWRFGFDLEEI